MAPGKEACPAGAAEFVDGFRRFWSAPDPADLAGLLTRDVRLVQPLSPVLYGLEEATGGEVPARTT